VHEHTAGAACNDQPFGAHRHMVLAAHQRERAQHEDPCEVHQRSDRTVSVRGVTGDDLEVERQGDEHQAGRRHRSAPTTLRARPTACFRDWQFWRSTLIEGSIVE
jgi:hypothetical protein